MGKFVGSTGLTYLWEKIKSIFATKEEFNEKEDSSNKVTSLSAQSTDTQYPSAKCVYDIVGDIESLLAAI